MITKFKKYNEGLVEDFYFVEVKKYIQSVINNGGLRLYDIVPERYFIIATDNDNNSVGGANTLSKETAIGIIEEFKKNEFVFKIYVEKPTLGAQLYSRTNNKWEIKNVDINDKEEKRIFKYQKKEEEKFKYIIDFENFYGKNKYSSKEFFGTERHFNNYINKIIDNEKYKKYSGHTKYKKEGDKWVEVK